MISSHVAKSLNISIEKASSIKNIIFDLGGVIINIDYSATIDAFKGLGFLEFDEIYSHMKQMHLFDSFETGRIHPCDFRDALLKYHPELSYQQIDGAWNAMLGAMPSDNIDVLKNVRKHYRTFMLSNTNAIHINYLMKELERDFGRNPFPEMFEKVFLSQEIGERKPNVSAYQYVLNAVDIKANETLFIDDLLPNIEGARNAGLYAYHLKNETIKELFLPY